MTYSFPYSDITEFRISDSSLNLFRSCPRKLEFRKVYGHGERDQTIDTESGKALHDGYQTFIISRDREQAIAAFMQSYPWELNDRASHPKSAESCYATLEAMMDHPIGDDFTIASIKCDDDVVRSAVEVPFEIEILGFDLLPGQPVRIIYVGYIDMILYEEFEHRYSVFDIKSHSSYVEDVTAKFQFKPQPLPYALVLEQILGHEIDELEVNYLAARVHVEQPRIQKYSFKKSREDIKAWAFDLWCDLTQLSAYMQIGQWKRNGDACFSFNKNCKFFGMCHLRDPQAIADEISFLKFPPETPMVPWIRTKLEIA